MKSVALGNWYKYLIDELLVWFFNLLDVIITTCHKILHITQSLLYLYSVGIILQNKFCSIESFCTIKL